MNKLIKAQLQKISVANIEPYYDTTKEILIPKFAQDKYDIGKCYLISLDDSLLNNYGNPILVSNWNNNTYPKYKYLKIDVIKTMGKMIYVNCVGFDFDNKCNLSYVWSGWLPIMLIKQIEKL